LPNLGRLTVGAMEDGWRRYGKDKEVGGNGNKLIGMEWNRMEQEWARMEEGWRKDGRGLWRRYEEDRRKDGRRMYRTKMINIHK
jgi:hypothetical protein